MRGLVRVLMLGIVAAAAAVSSGDQPAPVPPRPTPPAPAEAPPSPPAAPSGDIEDFVPSEKVKADDAVSFPTDI